MKKSALIILLAILGFITAFTAGQISPPMIAWMGWGSSSSGYSSSTLTETESTSSPSSSSHGVCCANNSLLNGCAQHVESTYCWSVSGTFYSVDNCSDVVTDVNCSTATYDYSPGACCNSMNMGGCDDDFSSANCSYWSGTFFQNQTCADLAGNPACQSRSSVGYGSAGSVQATSSGTSESPMYSFYCYVICAFRTCNAIEHFTASSASADCSYLETSTATCGGTPEAVVGPLFVNPV